MASSNFILAQEQFSKNRKSTSKIARGDLLCVVMNMVQYRGFINSLYTVIANKNLEPEIFKE